MKLLTIEEAAELLNTKVGTLYVWVHQRKIPFIKIGRKLAFSEEALIEYIHLNTYLPI